MSSRRQQLAPTYREILDVVEGDEGRILVALLDAIAALKDERDDALAGLLTVGDHVNGWKTATR